ncbi:hypothetical protein NIES4074_65080 (plasmid) [Cylindrospermum sp. NIES-4074]|nr:hypothetical protein NIES4074_65080 [Cylindrospermum sp. NIES-4074]
MKALHTKKFSGKKPISDAAIPVQSQIKSRPFVANSAPQSQELTQKPEEAKQQGFNLAQIPIFPGTRPAVAEMLQSKQAEETLGVQRMVSEEDVSDSGDESYETADEFSDHESESGDVENIAREVSDSIAEEVVANPEEVITTDTDQQSSLGRDLAVTTLQEQDQSDSDNESFYSVENFGEQEEQEQAGSSTNAPRSSQNPGNGQTSSQDVQQEEDNSPLGEIVESIDEQTAEIERDLPPESELKKVAAMSEQEQLPQHPPAPTRQPPPIPVTRQQQPRPPIPVIPQQEAQRMLAMDNTARAQRIAQLRRQGVVQRVIDDVIERLEELQRIEAEIARLEGRIPAQDPQQGQQPATRWERVKTRINKPFDNTKEPRKEVADGIKQHETYSDQTKILGQDSSQSNVDQVLGQNLPANDQNPNSHLNLPPGETEKFGNDAAVIGMTRDDVKAVGGLLLFHDSFKKFKSAFRDRSKPKRERIANASDGLGNMTSAVTYTGLVGTQARKGGEHHQNVPDATHGSGALAAVKQGGTIAGTSIPFDAGKAVASVLTTVPKLIMYTDAGLKAAQRENFGGRKSVGRGVKNVADLTKSAAGAVKDVSSLAYSIEQSSGASGAIMAGAEGAKIIAGGAVAPAAATVFGTAEAIQGGYKFKKAYKNKKGLAEIGDSPTLDQLQTLDQLKEIQKKKMKRAAINTVLGNVTLAAGVVGFSAGPAGLVAATAMGASVGAFQIGQWGTRKLKQKMRDKGVKGFDSNKTTDRKNEARKELAGNTLTMLEGQLRDNERDTIFSSMGLNGNKKDSAIQEVYNDVLARYLGAAELENPTTTVNRILKLKGHKNNLKQEVSWDKLSDNNFPADFREQVKKAAIDKALKKR